MVNCSLSLEPAALSQLLNDALELHVSNEWSTFDCTKKSNCFLASLLTEKMKLYLNE